jgi:hypothetical protein
MVCGWLKRFTMNLVTGGEASWPGMVESAAAVSSRRVKMACQYR